MCDKQKVQHTKPNLSKDTCFYMFCEWKGPLEYRISPLFLTSIEIDLLLSVCNGTTEIQANIKRKHAGAELCQAQLS